MLQEAGERAGLDDQAIRALIDTHLVRAESRRGAVWFELAHDRLIDPIRASNDAWYQVNLNAFQQQARLWQSQGRVPGYLLADEALAQAEHWAATQARLTDTEREYLEESIQHQRTEDAERQLLEEARARQQAEEAARHEAEQRVAEQALAGQRLRRWLHIAAVLAGLAGILAFVSFTSWRQSSINLQLASTKALQTLALLASSDHLSGDNERGALLARQAFLGESRLANPESVKDVDRALGLLLGADHFGHIFHGHLGSVLAISFDQAGDRLASAGDDGTVRLWNLNEPATPAQVLEAKHRSGANVVAFQPSGPLIASGGDDRQVLLQDSGSEHPLMVLNHEKAVRAIAFAPDLNLLATAGREGCLQLWTLDRPDPPPPCIPTPDTPLPIRALALRPGRPQLFSADTAGNIYSWDLRGLDTAVGPPVAVFFARDGIDASILELTFSPQGDSLAAVGSDGTIRLWNPDDSQRVPRVLGAVLGALKSVAFSPDGSRLASGGDDGIVRIWDVKTSDDPPDHPEILQGHRGAVNAVAFDPANRWLASAGEDGTIRLWELRDPTAVLTPDEPVTAFELSSEGTSIATSGANGLIQIRDLNQPAAPAWDVGEHGVPVTTLSADWRRQRIASGGMNGTVRIWSLDGPSNAGVELTPKHEERVTDLAFSPDGRWLVSSGVDERVRVWDLAQPDRRTAEAIGDPQGVNTVVFHPEGRWLAAAGSEGDIALWTDLANLTSQPEATFPAHEGRTIDMAIDPEARWLASAGYDGTIMLWRLDDIPTDGDDPDPRPEHSFPLQGGGILSIAFNHDGTVLASASNDGSILLWDLLRLESEPRILISNELDVTDIAFWENDQLVVRSGGVVHLWDTSLEQLADAVCDRVWRNLTRDEWTQFIGAETYSKTCPNLPSST